MATAPRTPRAPRPPQDRQPAVKPRVRRSTPAELAAPVDRSEGAIADVEIEENGGVVFDWHGRQWSILPRAEWRQSTNDLLMTGQINNWAAVVMGERDYAHWLELDPTNGEMGTFMEAFGRTEGGSLGDSGLAATLSRSMRRR